LGNINKLRAAKTTQKAPKPPDMFRELLSFGNIRFAQ